MIEYDEDTEQPTEDGRSPSINFIVGIKKERLTVLEVTVVSLRVVLEMDGMIAMLCTHSVLENSYSDEVVRTMIGRLFDDIPAAILTCQ